MKRSKFRYQDVMQLDAPIAQVHAFITDVERIVDYFPAVQDSGTFIKDQSIWCLDKSGVTLLEYPTEQRTENKIVMHVSTSLTAKPPYTPDVIRESRFLSLTEDWLLESKDGGTQLTKVWHSVVLHKMKWLPIRFMIKRTARKERADLINGWNRAAAQAANSL